MYVYLYMHIHIHISYTVRRHMIRAFVVYYILIDIFDRTLCIILYKDLIIKCLLGYIDREQLLAIVICN